MCGITISPPPANAASKLDLTGGTMTGQLVLQLASATGAVNVSPTWNNAGTNFTGIYGRVTNTASGASSKLLDLGTVAGGSLVSAGVDGKILATGYYYGSTAYGFDGSTGYGVGWVSNGATVCLANDNIGQKQFTVDTTGGIGFRGAVSHWYPDTVLFRTGEGRLALHNQTGYIATLYPATAQAFEVYNIYASTTDYERAVIDWQTEPNVLRIGTEKGTSGGSARAIKFTVDGVVKLQITSAGEVLFNPPTSNPGPGILWNDGGTPAIGT